MHKPAVFFDVYLLLVEQVAHDASMNTPKTFPPHMKRIVAVPQCDKDGARSENRGFFPFQLIDNPVIVPERLLLKLQGTVALW